MTSDRKKQVFSLTAYCENSWKSSNNKIGSDLLFTWVYT